MLNDFVIAHATINRGERKTYKTLLISLAKTFIFQQLRNLNITVATGILLLVTSNICK